MQTTRGFRLAVAGRFALYFVILSAAAASVFAYITQQAMERRAAEDAQRESVIVARAAATAGRSLANLLNDATFLSHLMVVDDYVAEPSARNLQRVDAIIRRFLDSAPDYRSSRFDDLARGRSREVVTGAAAIDVPLNTTTSGIERPGARSMDIVWRPTTNGAREALVMAGIAWSDEAGPPRYRISVTYPVASLLDGLAAATAYAQGRPLLVETHGPVILDASADGAARGMVEDHLARITETDAGTITTAAGRLSFDTVEFAAPRVPLGKDGPVPSQWKVATFQATSPGDGNLGRWLATQGHKLALLLSLLAAVSAWMAWLRTHSVTNAAALARSQRELTEAQRVARTGSWVWDIPRGRLTWSDEVYRIFGMTPTSQPMALEDFSRRVHPADRPRLDDAIAVCLAEDRPYAIDHRIVRPDGAICYVHEAGEVERDAKGEPLRLLGTVQDISDRKEAEEKLRESEQRFRLLTETVRDVFWISSPGIRRMVYVSPAFESIWGMSTDTLYARPQAFLDAVHPDDRERLSAGLKEHAGGRWNFTYRIVRPDGDIRWIRDRGYPVRDEQGELTIMMGVAQDITAEKTAEVQLQQAAMVFEGTTEAIIITDPERRVINVNQAFCELTGYDGDELKGREPDFLFTETHNEGFYHQLRELLQRQEKWRGEVRIRTRGGTEIPVLANVNVVRDDEGNFDYLLSTLTDISTLKEAEDRLRRLAHHDPLTGLPNRLLFSANLDHAIRRADRHRSKVALLALDLDRFKLVNDTMGHAAGDELLKEVAERLQATLRHEDTIARLGGDEFNIILNEVGHAEDAGMAAEKIIEAVHRPIQLGEREVMISTSIGISIYPDNADATEGLLKAADAAMYRAKERGRDLFEFYTHELTAVAEHNLSVETSLRHALERKEFFVEYQPQVRLADYRVTGVEALIRWCRPEGVMLPGDFIPVAEDLGIIDEIGEWTFRSVCQHAKQWQRNGTTLRFAVNLSGRQSWDAGFVETVSRALEETRCDSPCEIELEITESVLVQGSASVAALEELKSLGVDLAIDDFGTGYSSLSQLKQLPVDTLKIDAGFVADVDRDRQSANIIEAIVTMAHSLGLRTVAEGVERAAQAEALHRLGCDEAQGYYFSQPVAAEAVAELAAEPLHGGDPREAPA